MKYYLAARFPLREQMKEVAATITEALEWDCCSSWVFGGEDGLYREEIAMKDIDDIEKAQCVIVFTHPHGEPHSGGGRFVEMGYALGRGIQVFVIGNYENVFCHHPEVEVYPTLQDFILAKERQSD